MYVNKEYKLELRIHLAAMNLHFIEEYISSALF